MFHKLAVIIVVYQNYSLLIDLFASLRRQNNNNYHLFIVDLSDEKQKIEFYRLPTTIINGENKGYAHGVNLGLKKAVEEDYKAFCVINNDTILSQDFVGKVVLAVKNHPSSLIGGKIFYAPGCEFHKHRYTQNELGRVIWYAGGTIDWKNVYVKHLHVDEVDNNRDNQTIETEFISGCLMAFDKKVLDSVGYWNESYFLYYEDADYCVRSQRKGIKLYYDPTIMMRHKNAQSTDGSGSKVHQKYQDKNRLKFALKYAPLRTKIHVVLSSILESK